MHKWDDGSNLNLCIYNARFPPTELTRGTASISYMYARDQNQTIIILFINNCLAKNKSTLIYFFMQNT
jgi:hypothetical protein